MSRVHKMLLLLMMMTKMVIMASAIASVKLVPTEKPVDGANVVVFGQVYVATVYVTGHKLVANTTIGQSRQSNAKSCVQWCVSSRATACKSVAFRNNSRGVGPNCFSSTSCKRTYPTVIDTHPEYTFIILTQYCPLVVSGRLVGIFGQRLAQRNGGYVFGSRSIGVTGSVECGLACEATPTCVRADHDVGGSVCTHFTHQPADPPAPACPSMVSMNNSIVWIKPCNYGEEGSWCDTNQGFFGYAQQPSSSDFATCLDICAKSHFCVGVKYKTSVEYTFGRLIDRCEQYVSALNFGKMPSICTRVVQPASKTWVIRKNVCKEVSNFYNSSVGKAYTSLLSGRESPIIQATSATNELQCAITCIQSPTCVAFVFSYVALSMSGRPPSAKRRIAGTMRSGIQCWHNMDEVHECDVANIQSASRSFVHQRLHSSCSSATWDIIKNHALPPAMTTSTNQTNFMSCTKSCGKNCAGFTWNIESRKCGLLTAAGSCPNPAPVPQTCFSQLQVSALKKSACDEPQPASMTFTKFSGMRVFGGFVQPGSVTLAACLAACSGKTDCVGLDWNTLPSTPSSSRCFHHYEHNGGCEDPTINTAAPPCCDYYKRQPSLCSADTGFYVFRDRSPMQAGELQKQDGYAACHLTCQRSAKCQGFDINDANQCLFYSGADVCGQLLVCNNCTHYRRFTFNCPVVNVTAVHPQVGPQAGGTSVTLTGLHLNNVRAVYMGRLPCQLTARTYAQLVCTTVAAPSGAIMNTLGVQVQEAFLSGLQDTRHSFEYKPDPIIVRVEPLTTILMGGVRLTVYGTNLDIVAVRIMVTTVTSRDSPASAVYRTNCIGDSTDWMLCPTPAINTSELRTFPTRQRREAVVGTVNAAQNLDVMIGFELDGVQAYRHLAATPLKEFSQLTVYMDPNLETFYPASRTFTPIWPVNAKFVDIKVRSKGRLVAPLKK